MTQQPITTADAYKWISPDTFATKDGEIYRITSDCKVKKIIQQIAAKPIDKG